MSSKKKQQRNRELNKSTKNWPQIPSLITNPNTLEIFHFGQFLGEGAFAKCYEIFDKEEIKYACKLIYKEELTSNNNRQILKTEIEINSSLEHPNIVKMFSSFEDEQFRYIILEFCGKQSLMELSKKRKMLTEEETRYYMRQLLDAMEYCHKHRVIHRDLKLGNIFLSDNLDIKVGDFGLAGKLAPFEDRKKTICGTPNYVAPEVLFNGNFGHSFEADIWSLGVIMYTLLVGIPPFQTKQTNEIYQKIRLAEFTFPPGLFVSNESKHLITLMLNRVPNKRPSIKQIKKHPFFSKFAPETLPLSSLNEIPDFSVMKKKHSREAHVYNPNITTMSTIKECENSIENMELYKSFDFRFTQETIKIVSQEDTFEKFVNNMRLLLDIKNKFVGTPKIFDEVNRNTPILVSKFVDHIQDILLSYQLSNGSIGVHYKDKTSIVLTNAGKNLDYVYEDKNEIHKRDIREYFTTDKQDGDLENKIKVFGILKSFIEERMPGNLPLGLIGNIKADKTHYVDKIISTNMVNLFRFTNGTIQVNFSNNSKIIISEECRLVTIYHNNEFNQYKLKDIICSHSIREDILFLYKRLGFIKSLLEDNIKQGKNK